MNCGSWIGITVPLCRESACLECTLSSDPPPPPPPPTCKSILAHGRAPLFHQSSMSSQLIKGLFALISIPLIQSGHNFAHATTAQLSWHVQKLSPDWTLIFFHNHNTYFFFFFTIFILLTHKPFVTWVPGAVTPADTTVTIHNRPSPHSCRSPAVPGVSWHAGSCLLSNQALTWQECLPS